MRGLRFAAAFAVVLFVAAPARSASSDVVISQVYGGGGNTGAPFRNRHDRDRHGSDDIDYQVRVFSGLFE